MWDSAKLIVNAQTVGLNLHFWSATKFYSSINNLAAVNWKRATLNFALKAAHLRNCSVCKSHGSMQETNKFNFVALGIYKFLKNTTIYLIFTLYDSEENRCLFESRVWSNFKISSQNFWMSFNLQAKAAKVVLLACSTLS